MSDVVLDQTDAIAEAEANGMVVEKYGGDYILLDLDTTRGARQFLDHIENFEQNVLEFGEWQVVKYTSWNSKSGGVHVAIEMDHAKEIKDILICQSYLGSDGVRDFLSLMRVWQGNEEPRLLFRPEGNKMRPGLAEAVKLVRKLAGNSQKAVTRAEAVVLEDDVPF